MFYKIMWLVRAFFYRPLFGSIGNFTYLGKPVFLYHPKGIFVGKKVRIYPGSRMETHQKGTIIFEDGISIGQNLHIVSGGKLLIGSNTTISSNVLITNIDHGYEIIDVHIMQQPIQIKETIIGSNCFIGAGVMILPGTHLGKQCIVGSNSVVKGKFPDYSVIVGAPAKVVKHYDCQLHEWVKGG